MEEILNQIWNKVAHGLDGLKQVILGEFDENRDISAVIADTVASLLNFTLWQLNPAIL